MPYDAGQDIFTCPDGQPLRYKTTQRHLSNNGFESERRVYQRVMIAASVHSRKSAPRLKEIASIQVSSRLWRCARTPGSYSYLSTEPVLRKQRSTDVETVFGRINQRFGLLRFF